MGHIKLSNNMYCVRIRKGNFESNKLGDGHNLRLMHSNLF